MSWERRRKEILERALEIEKTRYSWSWFHIPAYPAELMKLVREELIKIIGKNSHGGAYLYKLTEKGKLLAKGEKLTKKIDKTLEEFKDD